MSIVTKKGVEARNYDGVSNKYCKIKRQKNLSCIACVSAGNIMKSHSFYLYFFLYTFYFTFVKLKTVFHRYMVNIRYACASLCACV